LLATADARLKVMSPQSLVDQFTNATIRANYANFGFVPYGQTIIGKLHYQADKPKACEEYNET